MGLIKWLRNLDGEKKEKIFNGVFLLGSLLGKGDKALAMMTLLDSVPGRVDALKAGNEKIDALADAVEDKLASGELNDGDTVTLELTTDELLALDDWKDLRGRGRRELSKLAKRVLRR